MLPNQINVIHHIILFPYDSVYLYCLYNKPCHKYLKKKYIFSFRLITLYYINIILHLYNIIKLNWF